MFKILFLAAMFLASNIAIGADAPSEMTLKATVVGEQPMVAPDGAGPLVKEASVPPDFITKTEPDYTSQDFLAKLMSLLTVIYMGMWMIGEILTRVSVWTENKWDNKAAERISQVTWFVGAFCGRMGWKLPKLVIEHEAEKITAKKMEAVSDKEQTKV